MNAKKTNVAELLKTGLKSSEGMLVVGFILMCIGFTIVVPVFATPANLLNVMKQSTALFMLVCGQTLVLLLAGIDLAQGSGVSFFSIISAMLVIRLGTAGGMAVALICGALYGLFCGLIITKFHVQPYIVSLGMMFLLEGATYMITQTPITGLPMTFFYLGSGRLFGIPIGLLVAIAVGVALWWFLKYTRTGRSFYSVGGNENVARLSGVRVEKAKVTAWVLNGIMVALAAIILTSRMQSGQPYMGGGLSNEALGGAVIGGTSLAGGKGGILQALIGVIIMAYMVNGLNLLGVSTDLKEALIGILIILVAWLGARK